MWESRALRRAFERLELHEGKLSRAVLRGGGGGDVTSLPDAWVGDHPGLPGQFARTLIIGRSQFMASPGEIGQANEAIYERPVVKRGGADFVSQGSRTSPSPSAAVDLAHLRPVRRRFSVHPATHPLSLRPREIAPPQCR